MGWYMNVALYGLCGLLWALFVLALLAHWAMLRTPGADKWGRAGKGERRVWWHSQNLNEKGHGRVGSKWRAGRAWLYLGRDRYVLRAEWHFWYWTAFKVGVSFGGGNNDVLVSLCSPVASLYFGVEGRRGALSWLLTDRECSLAVHNWTLWINPWRRLDEWCHNDPWWSRGMAIRLDDLLLGRERHSSTVLSSGDVWIPMPEGCYRAIYKVEEQLWSWPRYPTRRVIRYDFEILGGIPHEGKGENSWDCGEDATHAISLCADTLEEAVGKVVGSILEMRKRYGGEQTHRQLGIHRVNGTSL